ncbi:WD40-repeat-containing domain protein [Pelagophyceae sp. CCMP2097]|nr:WD40-repeat-containing domain protein [Pelagophyceae sp. CCMP2097]
MPAETDVERVAVAAFAGVKSIDGATISKDDFTLFCASTPEIVAWLEYYSDIAEAFQGLPLDFAQDRKLDKQLAFQASAPARNWKHAAATDADGGHEARLRIEAAAKGANGLPPWMTAVPFLEPRQAPALNAAAPEEALTLEWCHGFNAQRRQNAWYTSRGEVAYPAGSLCVVLDVQNRAQRFLSAHDDVVECLRLHRAGSDTLVASGQLGVSPKVVVWSANTMEVLSTLRGVHVAGVLHLDFSKGEDAKLLVTVGAPAGAATDSTAQQLVAVYEWRTQRLVFAASVPAEELVLDARFIGDRHFATCGLDHVTFWWLNTDAPKAGMDDSVSGKAVKDLAEEFVYKCERGLFCKKVPKQAILCVCAPGSVVVTGTASGHLLVWEGRACVDAHKAHASAITAIEPVGKQRTLKATDDDAADAERSSPGLATASTDGKVQLWTRSLLVIHTFDVATLGGLSFAVHSLCWDALKNKILVGTDAAELFEISAKDGRSLHDAPISAGHSERRLAGLAAHPKDASLAVSVGDDAVVYLWDLATKGVARSCTLDTMARCCAFSPGGDLLVVGLGGLDAQGKRQRKDGAFVIFDFISLTVIHQARDSKQPITSCAFSPDGLTLCLGSEDRALYLYNVGDFASTAKCRGHKGRVTQLDWSNDSKFLQSCDDVGELLFWEADSGEQRAPRLVRDVAWATQRCVFGWALQGTWDADRDDGAFLACCAVRPAGGAGLLASTDSFGRVQLWRYPCLAPKAGRHTYSGHAGPGGACAFTADGKRLLTTSRGDGLVLQWAVGPVDVLAPENARLLDLSIDPDILPIDADDLKLGDAFKREAILDAFARRDQTALFLMEERGRDEDFQTLKPWQRTIVSPSRPPEVDLSAPPDKLELEWAHGFRCHDARGLARYCASTGEVLFAAAGMVAKMDANARTQLFYREHSGEVVSLATHATQKIVASGEVADLPSVRVWDSGTMQTLACFSGHHRRAVIELTFSPDEQATYLVSIGCDDMHTCFVFDWRRSCVVCSTPTLSAKPLALTFNRGGAGFGGGNGFVTAGDGFIRFYEFAGRNVTSTAARIGSKGRVQPFLCLAWQGSSLAAGTLDGSIYLFLGRQMDRVVAKAHAGAVTCMMATNGGLVTGGRDGIVKVWGAALDAARLSVDATVLGALGATAIRSVHWDVDLQKILMGTLGAELFEIDASSGDNLSKRTGAVNSGHFGGELWGLSSHPALPQFCTSGDDEFLRVWSLYDKRQVRCHKLEMMSRACAYSPDGRHIAVGFGAPVKRGGKTFDGKFVVLDADDFQVLHAARDSQKFVTEMKYSPTGDILAVGSYDNRIYLYVLENGGLRLQNMVTQHNAPIRHFDFSVAASVVYLQSNCGAGELCFFEADTGMYIPAASRLKDTRWATLTCPASWAGQGTHAAQADGSDVSSMDVSLSSSNPSLATGDNFGRVRLWRYPATSSLGKCKEYRGHSAAVTRARWCGQASHLVTTSARDRTVLQWRHVVDDAALDEADKCKAAKKEKQTADEQGGDDAAPAPADAVAAQLDAFQDADDDDEDGEAKEALSRPWLLAAVPPSNAPPADVNEPDLKVSIDWVHGVEAERARSSVVYNRLGEVVLPAGRVAVVYSKASHSQRYYRGHAHALSALSASPDGRFVASGERARRPQMHVWNATSTSTCAILAPYHRGAIVSMNFSHDSKRLVSVGADNDGSLAVWLSVSGEWHDGYLACAAMGDAMPVRFACFSNYAPMQDESAAHKYDGFELMTGGDARVSFWAQHGVDLIATEALWGNKPHRDEASNCGCAFDDRFLTGTSKGHVVVWKGRTCERAIRAHEAAVESMHASGGAGRDRFFATGSRDGFVKLWNSRFQQTRGYDLSDAPVPPLLRAAHSIHVGVAPDGSVARIVVATASAEVYEVAADSGSWTLLSEGHFADEMWAVAAHPTDADLFATAGDDGTVRVWSVSLRALLRKARLDGPLRALAWSPDGRRLLVGMGGSTSGARHKKDGVFVVLDSRSLEAVHEGRDSRHFIRCVKYSPDGKTFAVASTDQKIYLYDAKSTALRAKCEKHTSPVTHLDFSADSAVVQSDSLDYEHLYHHAADGTHVRLPSTLKDAAWQTWSCVYGWPVQGCWAAFSGEAGRDPKVDSTATARSPDGQVVAAADAAGAVRFYRSPARPRAMPVPMAHSHVGAVSAAVWTCDGKFLITTGRADRTIVLWKVTRPDADEALALEAAATGAHK